MRLRRRLPPPSPKSSAGSSISLSKQKELADDANSRETSQRLQNDVRFRCVENRSIQWSCTTSNYALHTYMVDTASCSNVHPVVNKRKTIRIPPDNENQENRHLGPENTCLQKAIAEGDGRKDAVKKTPNPSTNYQMKGSDFDATLFTDLLLYSWSSEDEKTTSTRKGKKVSSQNDVGKAKRKSCSSIENNNLMPNNPKGNEDEDILIKDIYKEVKGRDYKEVTKPFKKL